MAMVLNNDDMFTADVIADPYGYYGRLREEDPIHWNELYDLWVITRHDDVVWMTRHHELFSNAVFRNDPRPAYPAILESDQDLYEYVRNYQADQFIQHDRPEHLEMRKAVHSYFTPRSMEAWRPFVRNAVKDLLDAARKGTGTSWDVATPARAGDRADDGRSEPDRPYMGAGRKLPMSVWRV
jgi:cytochrome P450